MKSRRRLWKWALVLVLFVGASVLTRGYWTAQIARSLVCAEDAAPSDAMLIENFDPNYLLFERAEMLERAGVARVALVPVQSLSDPSAGNGVVANGVSEGIARVMAGYARLRSWRPIPIPEIEPISLNAALQLRRRLVAERITSVIVVTPGFRSRRSLLVYGAVFGRAGIAVHCVPVFGKTAPDRWTETWHGIQEVVEEFAKLQYYRFYVLPFMAPRTQGW